MHFPRARDPWAARCLDKCEEMLDTSIAWAGPCFVAGALGLITLCAWTHLDAVFGQAFTDRTTPMQKLVHGVSSAWVIFNIFFNYIMCVRTPPGSTLTVTSEELYAADPRPRRWCFQCEKPKPDTTHHCNVCKACVLMMDHHCPWVHNCVGFRNYRYFFLFLFYLTVGCIVDFFVLLNRFGYRLVPRTWKPIWPRPRTVVQVHVAHRGSSLLCLLLAGCIALVVGGMLLWHVYLVCTAQGTIDSQRNSTAAGAARKAGKPWKNIYDMGAVKNWQERFDERGYLWWFMWTTPRLRPPRGNGYEHPHVHEAAALSDVVVWHP